MALEFICRKTLSGSLQPTDDIGREALSKIGKKDVLVTVKQARNPGQHRKLFLLLNLVYANQSRYPSVSHLLTAVKVALGFYTTVTLLDGREVPMPDSIAYHAMSQAEFEVFFEKVIELVVTKVLPGVKRPDLERELRDLTG